MIVTADEAARERARTVTLRPCAAVSGRIVDADGKPVSGGVHIRVASGKDNQALETELFPVSIEADGRFRIDTVIPGATYTLRAEDRLALGFSASGKMAPEQFKPFELVHNLTAESGQVIDLGTFNSATGQRVKEPEKITATTSEQGKTSTRIVPITGRILDLEGRPVTGATVQVRQITKPNGNNLNPWIESVKRGEPTWIAYKQLHYEPPIKPEERRPKTTTDAQGRFRFDGLEAERMVEVAIQGPTISFTALHVITRQTEPILARGFSTNYGSEAERIYGADFTYTAAPGRPVEGVVRDAATRQPLAGVQLLSYHFGGARDARNLGPQNDDGRTRPIPPGRAAETKRKPALGTPQRQPTLFCAKGPCPRPSRHGAGAA